MIGKSGCFSKVNQQKPLIFNTTNFQTLPPTLYRIHTAHTDHWMIRPDNLLSSRLPYTSFLAHANCTLFFTSRVAFVCKKKTRSFRVFPPEN